MGGACQRDVIRHRVRSKLLRHDGQSRMQNLPRLTDRQRPPNMTPCSNSPSSSTDCADRTLSFPRTLPLTRIGVCLQPTPAAAATDQLHHPASCRLVRRQDSSSVRAGSPSGRQYHRDRSTRIMVRMVVPEMRSNKPFLSKLQAFFLATRTGVQMPWK